MKEEIKKVFDEIVEWENEDIIRAILDGSNNCHEVLHLSIKLKVYRNLRKDPREGWELIPELIHWLLSKDILDDYDVVYPRVRYYQTEQILTEESSFYDYYEVVFENVEN